MVIEKHVQVFEGAYTGFYRSKHLPRFSFPYAPTLTSIWQAIVEHKPTFPTPPTHTP